MRPYLSCSAVLFCLLACHSEPKVSSASNQPGKVDVSPTASSLSVLPAQGTLANGFSTTAVHVTVLDTSGKPVANAAVRLSISGTGNVLGVPAQTNASGMTVALLASTVAEVKTIGATVDNVTLAQTVTAQFTAPTPDAAMSALLAATGPRVADGNTPLNLTLTVRDAAGVPMADQPITFSLSSTDGFVLAPAAGMTDAQGTLSTELTATRGVAVNVTALIGGVPLLQESLVFRVPACFGTVLLASVPEAAVGGGPTAMAFADLNADEYLDVAVAASDSGGVTVALGYGDGTFAAPTTYPTWAQASLVGLGDVTGDGWPDIVTLDPNVWDAITLINDGNGTFARGGNTATFAGPSALLVAKYTADTLFDALVGHSTDSNITLLVSVGDGNFVANPNAFPIGDGSHTAAMVGSDFNGDGNQDVALATTGGNISILLGDGNGLFSAPTLQPLSFVPVALAHGDINHDGTLDLIVASVNDVAYLLGNPNGSFAAPRTVAALALPSSPDGYTSLHAADVNGDGFADVMLLRNDGNFLQAQWAVGDGTGNFSPSDNVRYLGTATGAVAARDLNGDGTPDMITSGSRYNSLDVALWPTHQTSLPVPPGNWDPNTVATGTVVAADLNQDGIPDLVVPGGSAGAEILLGSGDGNFIIKGWVAAAEDVQVVAVNDFNGDTFLDLATATGSGAAGTQISVIFGNGDGTFNPNIVALIPAGGVTPVNLTVADFNRDGYVDIASLNTDATNQLSIFLGNGAGAFQPGAVLNGNALQTFAKATTGDFNGDRIADIAVTDYGHNNLTIYLGDGNGMFGPPRPALSQNGNDYFSMVVADLNGDTWDDLVALDNQTGDALHVLLSNGDGTFELNQRLGWFDQIPNLATQPVVADYNGDGFLDVAVFNSQAFFVSLYLGNGDGSLQFAVDYPAQYIAPKTASIAPFSLTAVDVNLDGWVDAVAAGQGVFTLLHSGCLAETATAVDRGGNCTAVTPQLGGWLAFALLALLRRRVALGRAAR